MLALLICLLLVSILLLLLFVVGRHLALLRGRRRAKLATDGVQEVEIVVRGSFRPSSVVVKRGIPARLLFNRQENERCSEQVIFSGLGQERWLPPFATTPVQFIPSEPGEFMFTCSLGMYQGRLVVEE
jgi:Cu+-exporting ATPase